MIVLNSSTIQHTQTPTLIVIITDQRVQLGHLLLQIHVQLSGHLEVVLQVAQVLVEAELLLREDGHAGLLLVVLLAHFLALGAEVDLMIERMTKG